MAWLEAWVTVAVDDDAALKALILAESLKRTKTTKKLMVIVGNSVSDGKKEMLRNAYDATIKTDSRNKTFDESVYGHLLCLSVPLVRKCIYLNCNIIAFKNADDLFELDVKDGALLLHDQSEKAFPGIVLYTPSEKVFEKTFAKLTAGKDYRNNTATTGTEWFLGKGMPTRFDDYYRSISDECRTISNPRNLLFVGFEGNVSERTETLFNSDNPAATSFKKKAYEYLEELRQAVESKPNTDSGPENLISDDKNSCPIAIVGIACRFGGCDNKDQFWDMLINKKNGVSVVPKNRWPLERFPGLDPRFQDAKGCFIDSIDGFDGNFFGMSPFELEFTDPQQRLLLEVVWESLEDAGINPQSLSGTNAGIFSGTWLQSYKEVMAKHMDPEFYRSYMGNGFGATAGRVSHFLGTTGPNIATESGCSSSMVAVGMGIQNLRRHATDVALCCGVNLLIAPFTTEHFALTSKDGCSKTFDADADGFGRGDGCSVLVLKRLSDAVRDNDRIYAQIIGYGEAQEGPSSSIGTPTVGVEALAMQLALKDAGTEPHEVSFVECHGTGTQVGDPLELQAVTRVYSSSKRTEPLVVASVKPNVGHTESCAGIAGIIKTVLALCHEEIPPHIGCTNLNPRIDLDALPAIIPFETIPWKKSSLGPRKAGVSSFGITGTDAHLILEEAPNFPDLKELLALPTPPQQILTLSAKSEESLNALMDLYENQLTHSSSSLSDICFTMNTGRAALSPYRAAVVGESCIDVAKKLGQETLHKRGTTIDGETPKILMVFCGQGNYYHGMGKDLYDTYPVFRQYMDYCFFLAEREMGLDFKALMWEEDPTDIMKLVHPIASFSLQYSTFKLWESFGVKPDMVLGHSVGEFVAAAAAGILTCEDALKITVMRQDNISSVRGKMLAVKAPQKMVEKIKKQVEMEGEEYWIDYCCFNEPTQTVVGGRDEAIEKFENLCKNNSIKCTVVNPFMALHTRAVYGIETSFRESLKGIKFNAPVCSFVSSSLGRLLEPEEMSVDYWVQNLVGSVKFDSACQAAYTLGARVCLDMSPHPILAPLFSSNVGSMSFPDGHGPERVVCAASLRRKQNDTTVMLESLATLHVAGVNIDWTQYHRGWAGEKISLPSYPFHRKTFWYTPEKKTTGFGIGRNPLHPLLGHSFPNATSDSIFQSLILVKNQPWVEDHKIGPHIIFPGAGYIEMALAGGHCAMMPYAETLELPSGPVALKNLAIHAVLRVDAEDGCELQTVIGPPTEENEREVSIYRKSTTGSDLGVNWVLHASGHFSQAVVTPNIPMSIIPPSSSTGWTQLQQQEIFYETLNNFGLIFGPTFQSIRAVWTKEHNHFVELAPPPPVTNTDSFLRHPVTIDAMIQALLLVSTSGGSLTQLRVPVTIGSFTWFADGTPGWVLVNERGVAELYGIEGHLLARMEGVDTMPTSVGDISRAVEDVKLPKILEQVWEQSIGPQYSFHDATNIFNLQEWDFSKFSAAIELQFFNSNGPDYLARLKSATQFVPLRFVMHLHDLGWNLKPNDVLRVDVFAQDHDIPRKNLLMLRRFFDMLAEDGYLSHEDDQFCFMLCKPLPSRADAEYEAIATAEYFTGGWYDFIKSCMDRFVPIAQGKESAVPILFPGDPNKLSAETCYRDFPLTVAYNSLLSEVLSTLLPESRSTDQSSEPIRILEVGAGTGSATSLLLHILRERDLPFVYTYTDLSPAFFINAEAEFGDLDYKVLDIERDPLEQGFSPFQFDLVLASNVIHATSDLKVALANCLLLTRKRGKLVLLEHFTPDRLIDGVFGLLDGYWKFTDRDLRPWHTVLDYPKWEETMKSVGYEDAMTFPIFGGTNGVIVATARDEEFHKISPTVLSIDNRPPWFLVGPNTVLVKRLIIALESCGRSVIHQSGVQDTPSLASMEGILYLWGLNPESSQDVVAQGFLNLVQRMNETQKTRVVLVTIGAGGGAGDDEPVLPTSGSLSGMARVVRGEFAVDVITLDLQSDEDFGVQVSQILSEMWNKDNEYEIAYREHRRLLLRTISADVSISALPMPNSTRFCLQLSALKTIEALSYRALPTPPSPLGPWDVEVRTEAAALNFKDVLNILKPNESFSSDAVAQDMAGVIVGVGAKVSLWKVGDGVMGFNDEGVTPLPSHLRIHEDLLTKLPDTWSFEEGAAIPIVFSTAYHCIKEVAKMKEGETLLVHAAAGGVGIAAIQIAKRLGIQVIATAGSRRKRGFLRQLMGIEHVFHSRNLSYGEDIARVTNGRGVDVVLNSLTSPGFKETTLQACGMGARFIEMSRLNIWTDEEVKIIRKDVKYHIVNLESMGFEGKARLAKVTNDWLNRGWLQQIPITRFDATTIRDAIGHLQKARHIGKITISMPSSNVNGGQIIHKFQLFNPRSTYLITGGLGGIGLEIAKWIAGSGAKTLVLIGRHGPSPSAQDTIDALISSTPNLEVVTMMADVGLEKDCRKILSYIAANLPPLRGIFHAAGTLSDSILVNQTWSKFQHCFGPKVDGSWILHSLSLEMNLNLEHFVLFSTVGALIGPTGQANHASANSYMDSLAHYRTSLGLSAISINWGQWGQVGVAANIVIPSAIPFTTAQALLSLELAIRSNKPQLTIGELNLEEIRGRYPWTTNMLTNLKTDKKKSSPSRRKWEVTSAQFWEEYDEGGIPILEKYVAKAVAGLLKLDEQDEMDFHRPFQDMGFDSLMMVELKNTLQTLLGDRIVLSVDTFTEANTVPLLAARLAQCASGEYMVKG